eukprot:jgi/Picre1/28219/NNA_003625.t1
MCPLDVNHVPAVLPNQAEREGRWWWEDSSSKECGLHSGNIVQGAVDQASEEEKVEDLFKSNAVETLSKDALQRVLDGPRELIRCGLVRSMVQVLQSDGRGL